MNKKVLGIAAALIVAAAAAFTMIGGGDKENAKTAQRADLNAMTVEEILAKAKEEGRVDSVGIADSWANWGQTWADLKDKYGIEHSALDMTSAEELAIFEAEKNNATKDMGEVGQSYAQLAESKGLTLPYKTSYWDDIPAWAKDDDGDWINGFYGTIAIITNRKLVPAPPKSFAEMLDGNYLVTVGNVAQATVAQNALLAAAIANGGSETNLQPGFDFFRKLAEQGRLDRGEPNIARLEKGEIACYIIWDFSALTYRDQFKANNPDAEYDICIPADGSVQSGYATIINAYAKRPHAASFAREYLLSDEGQINLARGYATPIRSSVVLPDDVKAKMLPREQYANARPIEDFAAWEEAVKTIGTKWQEEVMAYAR